MDLFYHTFCGSILHGEFSLHPFCRNLNRPVLDQPLYYNDVQTMSMFRAAMYPIKKAEHL
jgi:hypothetical protein